MRHHRFMSKTAHLLLTQKGEEEKKQLAKLIAAFGLLCGLLSSACGESSYLVLFTVGGRSTVAIVLHTEKIRKINRCPQDQALADKRSDRMGTSGVLFTFKKHNHLHQVYKAPL